MADKKYFWLKMPRNFYGKHYIKALRQQKHEDFPEMFGEMLVSFYIWLLVESIDHDGRLRYSDTKPYDETMLSAVSGFPLHFVTQALRIVTDLELLVAESDGTLFLPKAVKMIGTETAAAQRMRKMRENDKNNQVDSPETLENTECVQALHECSQPLQKCYIEKEKEIEIEINIYRVVDMYNDTCVSFPRAKTLSNNRKKAIKARLNNYSLDDFATLFKKAEASSFLKGKNNRDWTATFDWLIQDSNMAKVLDGNYDNKTSEKKPKANFEGRKYDFEKLEQEAINK